MSEFTYETPDPKAFVFTLRKYFERSQPVLATLLEGASCSINPSSSYSRRRWNAYSTSVTLYLPIEQFSSLTETSRSLVSDAVETIFPKEVGYDITEVDFSPTLIVPYELGASSDSLRKIIAEKDLVSLDREFARALDSVITDPPAAVTAASASLESLCKIYIEDEGIEMPSKQTLLPLWSTVQEHLGLKPRNNFEVEINKILSGMTSAVHGIGDLRTHSGSAHGRGRTVYILEPRHARLAIHAAHTLAVFLLETWDARKSSGPDV